MKGSAVQVQVKTDNHIQGRQALVDKAEAVLAHDLQRFADRITRVEVHLSDENSAKSRGDDKRCVVEARPAGHQPVAVTHVAATLDQALEGASEKLVRVLESTLGRLSDHKGRTSFSGE